MDANTPVDTHSANTMVYDADDVIVDMLDIAATFLCVGGRLTYLLPTFGAWEVERGVRCRHGKEEVPRHPCFELVANSEDKLTQLISRRLVTMKKVRAYEAERREEYTVVTRRSLKEFNLSYNDLLERGGAVRVGEE